MIKLLCSAIVATLMLALTLGATSASATLHIESCAEGGEECKPSSFGTTFTISSEDFMMVAAEKEEEGKEDDECNMVMKAKVTDSTSEGAEDPMSFSIEAVTFSSCTAGAIEAPTLPWTWSADQPSYEKDDGGRVVSALIYRPGSGCYYGTTLTDIVRVVHLDDPPTPKYEGNLLYEGGVFCLHLTRVLATDTVTTVNDPNFAEATTIEIG